MMVGRAWREVCRSSIDAQLARERWVVLLFKPGCSRCERALIQCLMMVPGQSFAEGEVGAPQNGAVLAGGRETRTRAAEASPRLAVLVLPGRAPLPFVEQLQQHALLAKCAGGACGEMVPPLILRLEGGMIREIAHDCRELRWP